MTARRKSPPIGPKVGVEAVDPPAVESSQRNAPDVGDDMSRDD